MPRAIALLVVFFLGLPTAYAGVNRHQAMFYGGFTSTPPLTSTGFLDAKDEKQLSFSYRAGKNGEIGHYAAGTFAAPYINVIRLIDSDTRHLRVGQTLALTPLAGVGGLLLLLAKNHTHYLTV